MVVFQSFFRVKIYLNDIFFIFKKLFFRLTYQNDSKYKNNNLFLIKKNYIFKKYDLHYIRNGFIT